MRTRRIFLFVAFLAIATAALTWLERDNARLRERATELRRRRAELSRSRPVNATRQDVASPRTEIRDDAPPSPGSEVGRHQPRADNFVPIELCSNVGAATPTAALETVIWAATKGDKAALDARLSFEDAVRPRAQELVDSLPSAIRQTYPTPESLAALWLTEVITGHETVRIAGGDPGSDGAAVVKLAFHPTDAGYPFTMRRGVDGWRIEITAAMMPDFERLVRGTHP